MKKHLFGAALILGLLVGGAAVAQTIDDIQVYNPTTGAAASPTWARSSPSTASSSSA